MDINSYPKVYAIGHPRIKGITNGEVIIEEKIDGSQFSFGLINGELRFRSKGQEVFLNNPEKMFIQAVDVVKGISDKLTEGYVYRCEYLSKPKHNVLNYSRIPTGHLIIFDIMIGEEDYIGRSGKVWEAEHIGLEVVPLLYEGQVSSVNELVGLLDTESILGGTNIEGFVIKNYNMFTDDKKFACGKYVSEAFKEVHNKEWKKHSSSGKDYIQLLVEQYRTEPRWQKAIQHLTESGQLEGSPKDIGLLMTEVPKDIKCECEDEIKEQLFTHFWPTIKRGVVSGLPEWYKKGLMEREFE